MQKYFNATSILHRDVVLKEKFWGIYQINLDFFFTLVNKICVILANPVSCNKFLIKITKSVQSASFMALVDSSNDNYIIHYHASRGVV